MDLNFKNVQVISDNKLVKVVLEYIGEGYHGDYDPKDSNDVPLLRYSLYRWNDGNENHGNVAEDGGDEWCNVIDGSYCTYLSIHDDRLQLFKVANYMLKLAEGGLTACIRNKILYMGLSRIGINDPYLDQENNHA